LSKERLEALMKRMEPRRVARKLGISHTTLYELRKDSRRCSQEVLTKVEQTLGRHLVFRPIMSKEDRILVQQAIDKCPSIKTFDRIAKISGSGRRRALLGEAVYKSTIQKLKQAAEVILSKSGIVPDPLEEFSEAPRVNPSNGSSSEDIILKSGIVPDPLEEFSEAPRVNPSNGSSSEDIILKVRFSQKQLLRLAIRSAEKNISIPELLIQSCS